MLQRCRVHWLIASVVCNGFLISSASAGEWGVQAFSSLGDIRRPAGGQTNFTFDIAGGPGSPIAEVMINDAVTLDSSGNGPWDRGTTHGFTGLTFSANHPAALRAEAILTGNRSLERRSGELPDGAVAIAGAFASDLFQYTGPAATTLSLTFTLEGIVSDPGPDPIANLLTLLDADVAVFADTPNYRFASGLATLVLEEGATLKQHNGIDAVDDETLLIDLDTDGMTETRQTTLMFDVTPGETFYVWQTLDAEAAFSTRLADAFSTLSSEFDQPQFVMSLSVPEPATVLLLGAGITLLLARRWYIAGGRHVGL